jgi:phosphoribosylamine--glycine ligase
MKVLVLGSGGREHAIVDALAASPSVSRVFCAPGNAGIAAQAERVPLPADDAEGLYAFTQDQKIDLVVVGPEQPLVDGIVDMFRGHGIPIFGPTAAAAQLEGSKGFSKAFMERHGIPTAHFRTFTRGEEREAVAFASTLSPPIVLKADGLAAGKGVLICEDHEEARAQIQPMLSGDSFGDAGSTIVVEEFLHGEEASLFVLTDGKEFFLLPPAQDHKRAYDDDLGKNTGGMGAYAPAPIITPGLLSDVKETIIVPTLRGMVADGHPYTGCLYVGLMITPTGPKVLEYNCRFGDPETQVVVPLIASDAGALFMSIARGSFDPTAVQLRDASAVCVVMASQGYPDAYEKGKPITGLTASSHESDIRVYHAGTSVRDDAVVTSGGRVLGVTALGPPDDLARTISAAYDAVGEISFDGAHYRKDIGARALKHGTS